MDGMHRCGMAVHYPFRTSSIKGTLLLGTDPVAMDTVELEAIEKETEEGAPSVWDRDQRAHRKL
jgi:hypothetical protein